MKLLFFILLFISCSKNVDSDNLLNNELMRQHDAISSISPMTDNHKIIYDEYKGEVFVIKDIDSNIVNIAIIKDEKIVTKQLTLSEDGKIFYKDIKSIAVNEKYILIIVRNYDTNFLYYFDRKTNYSFKRKMIVKSNIKSIHIKDSLIYFTDSYNYHDNDSKIKSYIEARNINSLDSVRYVTLDVQGIEMTHFEPYRNLDFLESTGLFIYSDLNNFNIKLVDKDLNIIDSIMYIPKYWNETSPEVYKYISDSCRKISAIKRIKYLNELFMNGLSKIYQIGFINDSTFYAAYHSGKKIDIEDHISYLEIFRIRDGKIVKFKEGLIDKISKNYIPIVFSDNIPLFNNNKAYFFSFYNYNSLSEFNRMIDWIRFNLSNLTGSRINMNLIEVDFYGL